MRRMLPGFAMTLTIAVISFLSSMLHPSFDALAISIIFGMLVANMIGDREMLREGVAAALRIFLPVGVCLYGTQLTFAGMYSTRWLAVILGFLLIFMSTYVISRGFGLHKKLSVLLATGMSVCGASAIAIIAPILGAKNEDTSISVISVMTIGLTGMLIYRFTYDIIGFSALKFAFMTGMTLPMLGQVKVASMAIGKESLDIATNVKLIRISALVLVAALAVGISRTEGRKLHVPWFLSLFFIFAFAANMWEGFRSLSHMFELASRFSLATALSAIGLSLDFDSITEGGTSPLFAVCLSWVIITLAFYLVLAFV